MSNGLFDEIGDLLGGDELPERVSNRLIFAAQQELLREIRDTKKEVKTVNTRMEEMENREREREKRLAEVERKQREEPSLAAQLRSRPFVTAGTILFLLLLWNLVLTYMGPVLYNMAGLPAPVTPIP